MNHQSRRPLSKKRIFIALGVAVAVDVIQIALGPIGWTFIDEVLDVVTCGVEIVLLGFHPLLLPTLVVEFIPAIDMLPTWTACVMWVIAARRKQAQHTPKQSLPPQVR